MDVGFGRAAGGRGGGRGVGGGVGALGVGGGEGGAAALGRLVRGRGRLLRGPVVDVPVVLVEEAVVLLQLGGRHVTQVR